MDKPRLIFIPIGGLGGSQLEAINLAVEEIPGVAVKRLEGHDDFRDSQRLIWCYLNANPDVPVFFAGHSLGAGTARNEANIALLDNRRVAGVTILDHVIYEPGPHESKCPNTLVFKAGNSFPFVISDIEGFPAKQIPGTNHNSLCQHPLVIAAIVDAVKAQLQ